MPASFCQDSSAFHPLFQGVHTRFTECPEKAYRIPQKATLGALPNAPKVTFDFSIGAWGNSVSILFGGSWTDFIRDLRVDKYP